jgi:Family of unknown function (DUF5317)
MSTFVLSILVGIGAGYLLGGRLRNLAALRVPAWFLAVVWLALALQVALRWLTEEIGYAFLLTTYAVVAVALGLYLASLFRTSSPTDLRAGVVLFAVGWLLNFAVIAPNHGMPFHGTTEGHSELFLEHVPISPDTKLRALGDILYVAPFREIVSAGDLVLAFGLAVFVCAAMRSPATRRPVLA